MDINNLISLSEICFHKGKYQQCLDICEILLREKLSFENLINIECILSNFSTLNATGQLNKISSGTLENIIKLISQNHFARYHSPYIKASLIQFLLNNGIKDKTYMIDGFERIVEETNDVFAILHLAEIFSEYNSKLKTQLIKMASSKIRTGYDDLVFPCSNLFKQSRELDKNYLIPCEDKFDRKNILPPEKNNVLKGTLSITSLILKDLIKSIPKHYHNINSALLIAVINVVLADTGYSCYFSLVEASCIRWKDNKDYLQNIFDSGYKKFKNVSYCLPELTKIADKYL